MINLTLDTGFGSPVRIGEFAYADNESVPGHFTVEWPNRKGKKLATLVISKREVASMDWLDGVLFPLLIPDNSLRIGNGAIFVCREAPTLNPNSEYISVNGDIIIAEGLKDSQVYEISSYAFDWEDFREAVWLAKRCGNPLRV